MSVTLNWKGSDVERAMRAASGRALRKVAFDIEAHAKKNIQENGQIDTGFMVNSVYTVTDADNTYGQANKSGRYKNSAGSNVQRDLAPQARLPRSNEPVALVAVGAEYAIWQELKHSFLMSAAQEVGAKAGAAVSGGFDL